MLWAGALLYWRYEDAAVERFDENQRDLTWLTAIILGANLIMAVIFFFLIVSCAYWRLEGLGGLASSACVTQATFHTSPERSRRLRSTLAAAVAYFHVVVPVAEHCHLACHHCARLVACAQLAFLHAPLMGRMKVVAKRWFAKKPKQRRARHGRVTDPNKPIDENDSEEEDSDDSDYKLKFEDNYETDQAWNVKNAEGLSKFTSMNPLAAATAADPRAARKQKHGDEGTHVARLNPALGQRLFKDQEAIAELSAQHMEQTTKATASAKEEANRPAPAALLVSRAYAGKGATKH
jgi:hypothetical protein